MQDIKDQYSDKGQYLLVKILSKYDQDNTGITKIASDSSTHSITKLSSDKFAWSDFRKFPIDTQSNTILSKMYFDYQRDNIPKEYVTKIASRLDTYIDLYNIPDAIFEQKPEVVKLAQEVRYLLPDLNLCKIASSEDLEKANTIFDQGYRKLGVNDRVEFSKNFMKCASDFKFKGKLSKQIVKYAAALDTDMTNLKSMLSIRVAAANRIGRSGKEYSKLASLLDTDDVIIDNKEDLEKLANVILDIDKTYGFDHPKYDTTMPCAYGLVFNKEATDAANIDDISQEVNKADIIGKYGHGILEEVENQDGSIDTKRLKQITTKLDLKTPSMDMK